MGPVPVTVILLTLNEEKNLPGALEGIRRWAEEVFIVDSCSTDHTIDIALRHGVKTVQRPFTNFGDQWNFALSQLPIKSPWTLKLDPDERLSDGLKAQIEHVLHDWEACEGYSFPRRLWFMGIPLHIRQDVVRLWKTGKCRFSDTIVNEHPIIASRVGRLSGVAEHLDSPDLHHWYEKQNRYSTMEAIMRYRGDQLAARPKLFGSQLERSMFLKRAFWRIPFRYQMLYLYHLLGQGAWRDGKAGRTWARLRTEIYRMIDVKYTEMRITGKVPEVPRAAHGDFDSRVLASPLQQQLLPEITAKV